MRDALPGDDLSGSRRRANLTYANCRSRKPLVMYPIGSMAGVAQNIDMRTPRVFVEVDTGDRALLVLHEYRGVRIISLRDYLNS